MSVISESAGHYAVAWLVAWYSSGLGYWASVAMAPQNSMVAAATGIMILGGFLNGVDPRFRNLSPFMKHVIGQSPLSLLPLADSQIARNAEYSIHQASPDPRAS